jgi:hypothetical protein
MRHEAHRTGVIGKSYNRIVTRGYNSGGIVVIPNKS